MDNIVVNATNITKVYKLYKEPIDRLKESISPFKKNYHKPFYALNDVNFSVKQGETVGIIGKNGSGKSTLLKIITGVLIPTNGNLETKGKISALLELGAGFNLEFTGIENIFLSGAIMGFSKNEIQEKLQSIIDFADIGEFIYQRVKTYSSGMFARLAFAVAINVDPDILIVDEALSVGDVAFQSKCYAKFNEFRENNKTILFVAHSMDTIIKYCSRAIVLNDGIKIKEGSPKDMVDVYKKVLSNCYVKEDETYNGIVDCNSNSNNLKTTNWKDNFIINPNFLEYGNKDIEIIDFGIFDENSDPTKFITSNEITSFKFKVKVNKVVDDIILAFSIKDLKGSEIAGTNTNYENIEIISPKLNDEYIITFDQRTMLNAGAYTLSLGCTRFNNDELEVLHRLYDILIFEVISHKNIFGIYDIDSKVTIEKQ